MKNRFDFAESNDRTVSERICETLRKSIILKILKPGERLVEAKLAKELTVSITPIRHAFSQLEKEGLINVFPFKGTYVVEITSRLVAEVGNVRKMLELEAARLAFANLSDDDCKKLVFYSYEMERLYHTAGSPYESNRLDIQFHQLFFERSQHKLLLEIWNLLKPRIQLLQSYGRVDPVPEGRILKRHIKIVDAIRSGSIDEFCQSIEEHLESGHAMIPVGCHNNQTREA